MNNKLLKLIEYLFYLMILLYLVGKTFEVLTILIDLIFIIYLILNKNVINEIYTKYKKLINAFSILVLFFLIQSFFTNNVLISLKHSVGMLRFIILLFAIIYVFNSKEKIRNIFFISFVSLFVVNADALYQYIFKVDIFGNHLYGGSRLTVWTDSPIVNLYSGEFFGLLLSSIFLLKGKYRVAAIFSFLFFIIIFFLSGNRSPIVALFSTIFIVGLISSQKKYFLILFFGLSLVFLMTFFNDKLYKGYSGIFNPTSNAALSGRHEIYKTSFTIIKNNFFFGIGGGMFRYEFHNFFNMTYPNSIIESKSKFKDSSPYHPHNIFLDIIISWGFIGLLIFINLFYVIYKSFIKNKEITLIASIGFIYCITPFQFAKSLSQSNWQFYTFLGLIFLIVVSLYEDKKKRKIIE